MTKLSLYDAKEGKKLTEDFHLDVNHNAVQGLLADPEGISENVMGDIVSGPLRLRQVCWSCFGRICSFVNLCLLLVHTAFA